MRILYDNLLNDASLSSLNATDTTEVTYLLDRLTQLKYLSTQTTDTISGMFATDQTISCIGIAFHNLTSATYELKDSSDSTVGSGSLSIDDDTDMTYFTAVSGVRTINVTINSSDSCYLGALSCGAELYIERHNVNPRFDIINKDSPTWLKGGQTTGNRTANIEQWRATVSTLDNDTRKEFKTIMDTVGNNFPVFADLYDENHSEQAPIRGILTGDNKFTRESSAQLYSTTIVVKEAK